jgi:hypothetical protein
MASIMGDENMEWAVMGCDRFQRERGGGGEEAPRYQRRMTYRRAMRRSGRPKEEVCWRLEVEDD